MDTPSRTDAALPQPWPPLDIPVLVRRTHDLLASRIPLTLLLDLVDDRGPHSREHYRSEGGDAGWLSGG